MAQLCPAFSARNERYCRGDRLYLLAVRRSALVTTWRGRNDNRDKFDCPKRCKANESATHSASTLSPHQTANGNAATPVHTPAPGRTPAAKTEPNKLLTNDHLSNRAPPAPPIIDLNEPLVRQGVGFTLLILGIVGVIVTRRWALRRT